MMPVPTHLKGIVVPRDALVDEAPLSADVRCPCGKRVFELLYPGQTHQYKGEILPCTVELDGRFFFVLRARCSGCLAEHLLLDADFHGWDGFVCHDPEQAALPRPALSPWTCRVCSQTGHTITVHIHPDQSREDFIEGAGSGFDPERWVDGFGWFSLDLTCVACGKQSPDLVSYETM